MTVNLSSFLAKPGEGAAYWFGEDLYTFKAIGETTGQTYALFEVIVQPQSGTPPHIHSREDESFYIQSGSVEFELDGQITVAQTGTFLFSPKGQAHRFTNIGSTPAHLLIWVTPAGFEKFIAEVGKNAQTQVAPAAPLNAEDIERVVKAARKYEIEILPPSNP